MQRAISSINTTANPLHVDPTEPTDPKVPEDDGLLTVEDLETHGISTHAWTLIMFIGYLIIGIIFYCFARPVPLSVLDSIYLSVITFTTIGYGDIKIYNRYFSCFYVLLGVGVIGTFFGLLSNDVMEAQEEAMQKRLLVVAKKMDSFFVDTHQKFEDYRKKKVKEYFSDVTEVEAGKLTGFGKIKKGVSHFFVDEHDPYAMMSEFRRANLEAYDLELKEIRSKGIVDFFFILVAVFSGAVCMMFIEDWLWEQSIYWACVTVTTVGYGDVTPDTDAGKVFTIIYAIVACSYMAKGFRDVVCYPLVLRAKKNESKILDQFGEGLSEKKLRAILKADLLKKIPNFQRDPKQVTKSEFMVLLLRMMNKLQEKDIQFASQVFDRLDVQKEGILSEEDQKDQIKKARLRDREKAEEMAHRQQMAEKDSNLPGINHLLQTMISPLSHLASSTSEPENQEQEATADPFPRKSKQRSLTALFSSPEQHRTSYTHIREENETDDL